MKLFIIIILLAVIAGMYYHYIAPKAAVTTTGSTAKSGFGIMANAAGQLINAAGAIVGNLINGVPVYTGTLPAGLTVQSNGQTYDATGTLTGVYNNGVYTAYTPAQVAAYAQPNTGPGATNQPPPPVLINPTLTTIKTNLGALGTSFNTAMQLAV